MDCTDCTDCTALIALTALAALTALTALTAVRWSLPVLQNGNQVMIPYYEGTDPLQLAQHFGTTYELSATATSKLHVRLRNRLQ